MSTRRPQRSHLVALLVLLVSVALCAAAVRASEDTLGADKITGRVGAQIAVTGGWVRVEDVRVGQTLVQRNKVLGRSDGLYVVARVTVAATGPDKLRFGKASLVTRDRTYDLWTGTPPTAVTGFSDSEQLVFEVDPAQLDDLTLTLRPGAFVYQYDELVAVALGITSDNAQAWRDAGHGRTLTVDGSGRGAALR